MLINNLICSIESSIDITIIEICNSSNNSSFVFEANVHVNHNGPPSRAHKVSCEYKTDIAIAVGVNCVSQPPPTSDTKAAYGKTYINQIQAQAYIQHKELIEISDRYGTNQWPCACCLVLIYDYFQWIYPAHKLPAKIKDLLRLRFNQFLEKLFDTQKFSYVYINFPSILATLYKFEYKPSNENDLSCIL